MPKKSREVWKLKEYNKCYCFERFGNVHTNVFGIRQKTNLTWIAENKLTALQLLRDRIKSFHQEIEQKQIQEAQGKYLFELTEDYFAHKFPNLAPASQKKIRKVFKYSLPKENFLLSQSIEIRNAILKNMSERNLSDLTKQKHLEMIKSLFNYGIENEYLEKNPIKKSIIPRPKNVIKEYFSSDDINRILEYTEKHHNQTFRYLILYIRHYMTRIEETLNLEWKNIHGNDIHFIRKGGAWAKHPIDIFPEIMQMFEVLPRTSEKIFPISRRTCERLISKMQDDLGLKKGMSFHAIRRFRENELIKVYKNDMAFTAKIAGHGFRIMEGEYVDHYSTDEIRKNLKS